MTEQSSADSDSGIDLSRRTYIKGLGALGAALGTGATAGTTSATVSGLAADTTYGFAVTAVNGSGNESPDSNAVTATTESAIGGEDWTATLTPVSSSELTVEFDYQSDSDWADIHYTVADGSQLNYRMTAQTSTLTHTISGLSSGDEIKYSFTYEEGGLAYDTSSYSLTY